MEPPGSKTTFSVSPLSFPKYGERSVAVRMQGKASGFGVVVAVVLITEGHTAITVTAGGLVPLPAKQLEMFAQQALDNLHKVTDA